MYSGDKLSLIVVADVLVNSNAYVLVLYRMLYKLILKLIYIYEIKKNSIFAHSTRITHAHLRVLDYNINFNASC